MYQREGKDAWWREAGTYTSAASTPGASLLEGTGLSPADAQLNSDPFKWVRSGTAPPPVQTSPDPSLPGSRLLGLLGKAGSPSPGNRKAAAAARLGGANQRHGFQFHSCLLKMSGLETVRHADWVRCGEQLCVLLHELCAILIILDLRSVLREALRYAEAFVAKGIATWPAESMRSTADFDASAEPRGWLARARSVFFLAAGVVGVSTWLLAQAH